MIINIKVVSDSTEWDFENTYILVVNKNDNLQTIKNKILENKIYNKDEENLIFFDIEGSELDKDTLTSFTVKEISKDNEIIVK